jgi:tetratricopeptide (TPR) repeat protein
MTTRNSNTAPTTSWLRELASYVDYSRFRRVWLHPATEQTEQGYLAACYERLAQRANSEGEYFLAHDAANNGLRCAAAAEFPTHTLTALKVTALARSGATGEAKRVMEEFLADHEPDSSVCSAQARLFRDLGLTAAAESAERRRLLNEAARWAARGKDCAAEEEKDWAYPANQEVQFRFLAGDREIARAGAMAVIAFVEGRADAGSMWNQINLAEMRLVRGELAAAGQHYEKAAELGTASPGDVAANRAVAEVLMRELAPEHEADRALLESWFPKPVLVVFAGHIPDAPDRPEPRLPEALCRPGGAAATAISERLGDLKAVEGICASAPGGDILFAEALIGTGARLALVDPFPRHRIEKVAADRGEDWPERLAKIFGAAARSESIACAEDANETAQCEYATQVMLGSAMLRARRINAKLHALVLWDETDADSPIAGGTGQFVLLCRESGVPVETINPLKLSA